MALPDSREAFKDYCLRQLGQGAIRINVTTDQVDDRVDEALRMYADYHFDGVEKQYYKYKVTSVDIRNKYIPIPENITGVVSIFDYGFTASQAGLFDIRYQMVMNDLYMLSSVELAPYYMTMEHIQFMQQILVGKKPIRYNRNTNKLYIDMDWTQVSEGSYLIVEAYQVVDPDTYTDVWKDRWLANYCTALIKKNWAMNLKKFSGLNMPGPTQFNGQRMYDEAVADIMALEKYLVDSYSLPCVDMIG